MDESGDTLTGVPGLPLSLRLAARVTTVGLLSVLAMDVVAIGTTPRHDVATAAPAIAPLPASLRVIDWAGRLWVVSPDSSTSPFGTPDSDSSAATNTDSKGHLHFRFVREGGVWRSTGLTGLQPAQYGTYTVTVAGSPDKIAHYGVFGFFVYHRGAARYTKELDVEDSHALYTMPKHDNAQFVVQPYTKSHNIRHYRIPPAATQTRQTFTWRYGYARFTTSARVHGHWLRVKSFSFRGSDVPTPSGENLYLNFWLHTTHGPGKGLPSITVDSLTYSP